MKNYFGIDLSGKSFLVVGLMIFMGVLSACGSPSASKSPVPTSQMQGAPAASVSYSKDVFPILEASCIKCHGVEKVNRGLDMTSYEKTMKGSVKGPVVLPGDAENSPLVNLIAAGKMPKQGNRLTQQQIDIIRAWIDQGAPNN
jgi:hypothetical protein